MTSNTSSPRSECIDLTDLGRAGVIADQPGGVAVRVTVWFDGACPLCQREIALMRRLDARGAIRFIDAADLGEAALCPLDPVTLLARFHAEEDGRLLSGAAAFAAMWRAIPLLRPLGELARNPLVLGMLEGVYLVFLKLRPRLQRIVRRLL